MVRHYIKHKGGDPRNHSWVEVGEEQFRQAKNREFFKKELAIELGEDPTRRQSYDGKSNIHKKR
jgi:hypothetical protein